LEVFFLFFWLADDDFKATLTTDFSAKVVETTDEKRE